MVQNESDQDGKKKVCWKRWRKCGKVDAATHLAV